jgi:hypothetical protein
MEDILDVYQRPYDPERPLICFDEGGKELHGTPRGTLPVRPGQPARQDYEWERHGMANLFVWIEPLTGRRRADVTARHTAVDFAHQLLKLVDESYPEADRIVLVTDNLNIHTPASLYEAFEPAEAHRIARKLEWHYTPKHGSWLNIAEIELSVLARQCLDRRISDLASLEQEVKAWERRRNALGAPVRWQFTTADARIRLAHLYPTYQGEKSS